jgi:hypothetical protein
MGVMMIELTSEEVKVLQETLTGEISELGMEIADTDRKDFRDGLKKRKALLLGLVEKLKAMAA